MNALPPHHRIIVLYTFSDSGLPRSRFMQLLAHLPENLQQDIMKYKQPDDQARSLFGKLLLRKAVQLAGFNTDYLHRLSYTSYKRPFIGESFDFNISHSGNCVTCILGKSMRVGIDVEEIKPVPPGGMSVVTRADEAAVLTSAPNSEEAWIDFWTQKEAVLKASGEGFHIAPQEIYLSNACEARLKESVWYLRKLMIREHYACHMATNQQFDESEISVVFCEGFV